MDKVFGHANMEYLLNHAKSGHMDDQTISDFAQFLGEKSKGGPNSVALKHKKRQESGSMDNGREGRYKGLTNILIEEIIRPHRLGKFSTWILIE